MPSLNSHADIIRDWEMLLDAAERSPEVLEGIVVERDAMAQALGEVRTLKARQDELTALRQQVTQQLNDAVTRGKETAIRLRAVVKAKFGPKSERLVHFKVAPLRRRPRKPLVVEKLPARELPGTPSLPVVKPLA